MTLRCTSFVALAAALALAAAGCEDAAPVAGLVTEPPPPATTETYRYAVDAIQVTASTAEGVVFLVYDPSKFSGTAVATDARSLDDTLVRVEPTTRESTVQYGAPHYTGRVFTVYGVSPGKTEIEVFQDGASAGRMPVTVLAQE